MKKYHCLVMLFIVCLLLFSCTNSSIGDKSTLEIEKTPIIEEIEEVDDIRVISVTNAKYYLYKMEPLWSYSDTNVPYGSTINNAAPRIPGTDTQLTGYEGYACVEVGKGSLGFFDQGKWKLTLYVLDVDGNKIIKDPIVKEFFLNTFSNKLSIDLDSQMFTSGTNCNVVLNNFRFELTDSSDLYGKSEKNGYKLTITLSKVNDGLANSLSRITSFDVDSSKIVFESKSGLSTDPNVLGVINNLEIASGIQNGSYIVSIKLYEHNGTSFVDAGGMTFSFVAINGFLSSIEGNGSAIDLKAADYVTPGTGESGIIIDSGTDANVTIKTDLTATSTVTDATAVTFTGEVNGKATSGQWFVNGESKSSGSTFSYTPTGMSGKTVTITYMILDSSYNTISANYYLTVSAS